MVQHWYPDEGLDNQKNVEYVKVFNILSPRGWILSKELKKGVRPETEQPKFIAIYIVR
jgi:hypothetical protein